MLFYEYQMIVELQQKEVERLARSAWKWRKEETEVLAPVEEVASCCCKKNVYCEVYEEELK